jgi:hypothetical protein
MFITMPKRARAALLLPAVLLASGCGTAPPPEADADLSRRVLTAALDAWKGGAATTSLSAQSPPIRVIDGDWERGSRLVEYQIVSEGQPLGLNRQCAVALTLKDPKGREVRKTVTYVVAAGESPVVSRQDADF